MYKSALEQQLQLVTQWQDGRDADFGYRSFGFDTGYRFLLSFCMLQIFFPFSGWKEMF